MEHNALRGTERRQIVRIKVVLVALQEVKALVLELLRGSQAFDCGGVLLTFLEVGVSCAVALELQSRHAG